MTDSPTSVRRYSEQEVAELLRRATEQTSSNPLIGSDGLSLAELQEIGREAGIDSDRLAVAAREMDAGVANRASPLLGARTRLHSERSVKGEVQEADIPELLAIIRRVTALPGTVSSLPNLFEWSSSGEAGTRHVSISTRDGVTSVRVTANIANTAILSFVPAGALGLIGTLIGIATFIKSGTMVGLTFGVAMLPTTLVALRELFKRLSRAESRRLDSLAAELAACIAQDSN